MKFSARQRRQAHRIVLRACATMLEHPGAIHYTQGPSRWEGISQGLRIVRGEFPKHGDCSSTVTWILWNAVTHAKRNIHAPDIVNDLAWRYGNTGSMRQHGRRLRPGERMVVGDQVHYGSGGGKHVAIYIGGGYVFSHGSEGGPYKLPVRYRRDFDHVRRVLLAK